MLTGNDTVPNSVWRVEDVCNVLIVSPTEKHCESLLRCMQQTKSTTALTRLLQPTALLLTGLCYINFSMKNPFPAMQLVVKIL